MSGEVAGSIGTTARKPRAAKKSLQQHVAELDVKIRRAEAKYAALVKRRSDLITSEKVAAEARAAEIERIAGA